MIFDSHAHYDDEAFDKDRDELLGSLEKNGIKAVVNVGAGVLSSRETLKLAKKYDFIYAAIGAHPENAAEVNPEWIKWLIEYSRDEKVVAIGEIGLDYHYPGYDKGVQWEAFEAQLDAAEKTGLPVIIHSRDAAEDTLSIIKEHIGNRDGISAGPEDAQGHCTGVKSPGVIHCFSYSRKMAEEYIKMGFYIGVGGVVTFSNGKKLKEVVSFTGLDRILLETDCPYLSPEPNRGKRNSSLNLPYVAEEIAKIKNISREEVIKKTWDNAVRMYNL